MRTDVTFRSGDDWCAGWLYRPEGFEGPRPLMVMAHGFSGTKELRLPPLPVAPVVDGRHLAAAALITPQMRGCDLASDVAAAMILLWMWAIGDFWLPGVSDAIPPCLPGIDHHCQ